MIDIEKLMKEGNGNINIYINNYNVYYQNGKKETIKQFATKEPSKQMELSLDEPKVEEVKVEDKKVEEVKNKKIEVSKPKVISKKKSNQKSSISKEVIFKRYDYTNNDNLNDFVKWAIDFMKFLIDKDLAKGVKEYCHNYLGSSDNYIATLRRCNSMATVLKYNTIKNTLMNNKVIKKRIEKDNELNEFIARFMSLEPIVYEYNKKYEQKRLENYNKAKNKAEVYPDQMPVVATYDDIPFDIDSKEKTDEKVSLFGSLFNKFKGDKRVLEALEESYKAFNTENK